VEKRTDERLAKSEMSVERSLDEVFYLRDQLKHLSEDRKKDVEETADFIKQIIAQAKDDFSKE